jgi:RNA polymerase sigma-70 factor (ECF subfamily)
VDRDERFEAEAIPHLRALYGTAYRMTRNAHDAEDLVQETFLRAWRRRASLQHKSSLRPWLYRIATNACLDWLARNPRHMPSRRTPASGPASPSEISWLQPFPDRLLQGVASDEDEPETAVVSKETIELAFLVAIQHLPARQRAVLILRDVLGWPASDTASLLDATVASANSALQRARATLRRHLPANRFEWSQSADARAHERTMVHRYMDAAERGDTAAIVALLHEDISFAMPPEPESWTGREEVVASWTEGCFGTPELGDRRCLLTAANMQPAVAGYSRRAGEVEYRPLALDVLRIEDGLIKQIITFAPKVFPAFGLPPALPASSPGEGVSTDGPSS